MGTVDDKEYAFLAAALGETDNSLTINDLRYRYYSTVGAVVVDAPADTGTFTLKSTDGSIAWVEDE